MLIKYRDWHYILLIIKIIAIAIVVLIVLYLLGGLLLRKKLFLKKGLIFVFIIAVGGIVITNQFGGGDDSPNVGIPEYQENAPPIELAPQVVRTYSRVYYVAVLSEENDIITMHDYYFYDEKEWEHSVVPVSLDKEYYGEIKVYNR